MTADGLPPAKRWCSTVDAGYIACDDFDESAKLSGLWTAYGPSSSIAIDQVRHVSPPNSVFFDISNDAGLGSAITAGTQKTVSTVDFSFEVWPVQVYSTATAVYLASIVVGFDTATIYVTSGGAFFQQFCSATQCGSGADLALAGGIPTGTWTAVHIHMSIASSQLTVSLNGTPSLTTSLDTNWLPAGVAATIGDSITVGEPVQLYYDDVVLYAQ